MRLRHLLIVPLIAAGTLVATPHVASANSETACTTLPSPPNNCKTVTVDGSGLLTSPTTSGTISFYGLTPLTTYSIVDAIEGVVSKTFVTGTYTLTFGTCTNGTATSSTYTVTGGGSYPKTPPNTTGTLSTITTDATGTFSCSYTLSYPTITLQESVRNDVFVLSGGTVVTQVASASVHPGGGPIVPEAALAAFIPLTLLLVGGGYLYVRSRRAPATV